MTDLHDWEREEFEADAQRAEAAGPRRYVYRTKHRGGRKIVEQRRSPHDTPEIERLREQAWPREGSAVLDDDPTRYVNLPDAIQAVRDAEARVRAEYVRADDEQRVIDRLAGTNPYDPHASEYDRQRHIAWEEGVACGVAAERALADEWKRHAERLAEALRLTQEYVGSDLLPPLEGWSWFDALQAHAALSAWREAVGDE